MGTGTGTGRGVRFLVAAGLAVGRDRNLLVAARPKHLLSSHYSEFSSCQHVHVCVLNDDWCLRIFIKFPLSSFSSLFSVIIIIIIIIASPSFKI